MHGMKSSGIGFNGWQALQLGLAWAGFFGFVFLLSTARAQGTDWPNEYAKRVRSTENVSPLSDEAFGDKINLFNGTVRFSHDLISLPGNSSLPVALGIFLDPHDITQGQINGNWDLDIPNVSAVHHSKSAESNGWVPFPPYVNNGYVDFDPSMFWSGNRLTINGGGGGDLLKITDDPKRVKPNNSVTYTFTTKDGWYFSDLPSVQNGPGKGLVGYAPDGTKYTFDWLVYRRYSSITHPWGYTIPNALLHRYKLKLYVTKVEDRFGNWVKYDWEYDHPKRIYASDGREITMTYTDAVPYLFNGNFQTNILSATANGRQWTFTYPYGYGGNVQNPDGTQWKYDGPAQFNAFRLDVAEYLLNPDTNQTYPKQNVPCSPGAIVKDTTSKARITHPSGAIAEYVFKSMRHGRTSVPYLCETGLDEGNSKRNRYSTHHDTWSLIEKHISGPNVAEQVYRYAYDGLGEGYEPQDESRWDIGAGWNAKYAPAAPNYKTVTVTEPDGTQNVHTFGRDRDINEGQLFRVETRKNGSVYKIVQNEYLSTPEAINQPFPEWMGSSGDEYADRLPNANRPLKTVVTTQDNATFNRSFNSFDALVRPLNVRKWSSGTQSDRSRSDTTEYHDDLALWVLGQPKKEINTDTGWVMSETTYNDKALPVRRSAFGRLVESYGYHADGTLASVTDGRDKTTSLSNWKRGLPQSIQYPDQTAEAAVVDDNGWISSVTDENSFATTYAYDAAGRLQSISYPGGDSNAWHSTHITFSRRDVDEYGLAPGHWLQSTMTGNRAKNVFLDALWRPVLVHEWDGSDLAGTLRSTAARYDDQNRPVFASYPGVSTTAPTQGMHTEYDTLGRTTLVKQDSELGQLMTRTEYLPQLMTRVTNPRQQQTTTLFQAFDQPGYDVPVGVVSPEGIATELHRDLLGSIQMIKRRNGDGSVQAIRQYIYDQHHRPCKSIEPETGATIVDYDLASNVAWSASGVPAPATDACNRNEALASGRAATRTYDSRNRVKTLNFPDGRGNQSWDYYPDGQVKQIATYNASGTDWVFNTYEYNKRRFLTRERLQLSGVDWAIGQTYTNEGSLDAHTYPDGQTVAYAANALGQPRQAGTYATGVSYYPNGGMSQFTYGNGIVHTLQQNLRGLAERSRDAGNAAIHDDNYDYDANGNVAAISDGLPGARGNRSMVYDGVDRLTAATSTMFGTASYSYDVLDNLKTVSVTGTSAVPGRNHTYLYDAANRLELVQNTGTTLKVIGLGYDAQGNLENKNGQQFKFDFGNRLREATGKETYRYDGHGRRVLATSPTLGNIVSMYGQDGVLRYQRDYRKEKDIAYINLNGSLVARATTPTAPDVPVVDAPSYASGSSFTVSWSAVTASGSYELHEQANGDSWQGVYSGGERNRSISGKADGNYGYRARACNAAGCGGWSTVATVEVRRPPATAPVLTAPGTALNGQYAVSWSAAGGATDYVLEESFNSGEWTTAYTGTDLNQSFVSKPYGAFGYRIKACNPAGCGPISATSTVNVLYPPGSAPTVSAPAQSDAGSFTVSWNAIGGATSYQLEQSALGGGWTMIQDADATSRVIYGGTTGTYSYRVRACNAAGCGATSAQANVQVIGPPTAAPSLDVPTISNTGTFGVGWTGVATATVYQLEESREGAAWTLIHQDGSGGTTVWGRGDGRYGYHVRGCNPAGCGPYSEVKFITIDLPPATPTITLADWLRNTLSGRIVNDTCTVRWTAAAKTTAYELQSSDNGALLYRGTATQIASSTKGQYCTLNYAVRACGSGGCSAWSTPPFPATRRTEPMD
ncbi:RHS Repeat family protein [Lysobacter antibioticus]|uniref:RHS Repeat family protein n=2 Tax=Lysobacter antibioticus TaxID=84531 RepID=A0A0S2F7P4_LYSAN|nr:RHS Repeat family protein [Lysobacter antibioticus]